MPFCAKPRDLPFLSSAFSHDCLPEDYNRIEEIDLLYKGIDRCFGIRVELFYLHSGSMRIPRETIDTVFQQS